MSCWFKWSVLPCDLTSFILKHYGQTDEKVLALTCTERLQTWHKKSSKCSVPMVPLSQIKMVSAWYLKAKAEPIANNQFIAADPGTGHFKRHVNKMAEKINQGINKLRKHNVEMLFYIVLKISNQGQSSSLFGRLHYKHNLQLYRATADHDYLKIPLYNKKIIEIDEQKILDASTLTSEQSLPNGSSRQPVKARCSLVEAAETTDDINDIVNIVTAPRSQPRLAQLTSSEIISGNNEREQAESYQSEPSKGVCIQTNGSNYFDVDQNTPEWHNLRRKMITGSCWPYLVGLHGHDKFDRYWQFKVITEGHKIFIATSKIVTLNKIFEGYFGYFLGT